jgi:excisionase family DNA binding protein
MAHRVTEARTLTSIEAAVRLNCSVHTIRRMCKRGQLRYLRLGREYRITEDAIAALEEQPSLADDADAARWIAEARAAGRLPAEPPAEVLGRIAEILRRHYAEQADLRAG